jgi:hypothetical protein
LRGEEDTGRSRQCHLKLGCPPQLHGRVREVLVAWDRFVQGVVISGEDLDVIH